MTSLSITIDDREVKAVLKRLNLRSGRGLDAVEKALDSMAFQVQANAAMKQIIRGGKGPPHPTRLTSRTGTLRRSIRVNRFSPLARDVGTDLVYGAVHELHPTRPRPFLSPALEAEAPKFDDILRRELQRVIDRA